MRRIDILKPFSWKKNGFEIYPAEDGESGIRLAETLRPDLILLDIQLPDMDGYAVARALRNHAGLKNIPIVAVTSYAMAGEKERILNAGFNDYIEKPINPDTFIAQIVQSLSKPVI